MNGLIITRRQISKTQTQEDFCYTLHNPTDAPIWLGDFELLRADSLAQLGVTGQDCKVYRSGRHKNDMPTVATLGRMDEAMLDALGAMSESGDKQDAAQGQRMLVSDHLTVLGNENGYCMLAMMTGRDQLFATEIALDHEARFLSLSVKVTFGCFLYPGETTQTETLRVEHTTEPEASIRRFAQEKAERYGARVGNAPPSVFCTWYYYGLTVSQADVMENLARMQQMRLPFDVFQIDEGWEKTLGWWERNEKFPTPMKEIADRIREAGYRPGIWTSPFVAKESAPVWQEHPQWVLRNRDGQPCLFPMNDTTYWIFDITNPQTWAYFEQLYRTLTFDWGYTYHKLDFTRAAVVEPDACYANPHITLARAYYEAVAAIRRGMGEDAYFLMCGGLYDPIIGLVDAQRSGSDVLSMWSSNINKGGKTAPYTIKQSLLRYYMNDWWHNDPDALMVRRNAQMERGLRLTYGLLTDTEVRTVVVNQLLGGGLVCSTEPLARIDRDRLLELRHVLPPMKTQVEPLAIMQAGRFPARVRVCFEGDARVLVAQINWSDTDAQRAYVTLDAQTLGEAYDPKARYVVCDFYAGTYQADVCAGETLMLSEIEPHGAAVIKVEKMGDQPIIVSSDAHFSMGLELERLALEEGCLIAEGEHRFDCSSIYTALIPSSKSTVRFAFSGYGRQEFRQPL